MALSVEYRSPDPKKPEGEEPPVIQTATLAKIFKSLESNKSQMVSSDLLLNLSNEIKREISILRNKKRIAVFDYDKDTYDIGSITPDFKNTTREEFNRILEEKKHIPLFQAMKERVHPSILDTEKMIKRIRIDNRFDLDTEKGTYFSMEMKEDGRELVRIIYNEKDSSRGRKHHHAKNRPSHQIAKFYVGKGDTIEDFDYNTESIDKFLQEFNHYTIIKDIYKIFEEAVNNFGSE